MHLCRGYTVHLGAKFGQMANFDGDDNENNEHVSNKIVERISDDFFETNDENKNKSMKYPMEKITLKSKTHNYRCNFVITITKILLQNLIYLLKMKNFHYQQKVQMK